MSKKYLLISEVAELLGISQSSLRYLEKAENKIKISKIRGRRYYKDSDISKITKLLSINYKRENSAEAVEKSVAPSSELNKAGHNNLGFQNEKPRQLDMFAILNAAPQLPILSDSSNIEVKPKNTIEVYIKKPLSDVDFEKIKERMNYCRERLINLLRK